MAILRKLCLFGTLLSAANAIYTLRKNYDATNFFDDDSFNWYDGWDSFNKGFTIYVNKSTALSSGLAAITSDNQIYLGMDYQTKLTTGTNLGRNSIRLTAVEGFTTGLLVADIERMPSSICGVWNAYWLVRDWKGSFGEIDMVEQAFNARTSWFNAYTMFEGQCQMKDNGGQVQPWATDCKLDPGPGCHANAPDGTYGDAFNAHNGGFYATQVEADGIKIWYFVRGTEPANINGANPDTTKWGTPTLNLGVVDCDVKTIFREMQITINTITCGTIGAWSSTGCDAKTGYPTCDAYVAANPAAFKEAYYLINSIKLYQDSVTVPQVSSTPIVSALPSKTAVLPSASVCPPAPTSCSNAGLQFALQNHPYTDTNGFNVDPNHFKTAKAVFQSATSQSYFTSGNGDTGSIYAAPNMQVDTLAINARGYIYARYTGTYTFTVDKFDNRAYVWVGKEAYSGWDASNARAIKTFGVDAPYTFTVTLQACSYTPYRVLEVNGGGPMTVQYSVTDPLGYQIIGPNSVVNDEMVQFSCDLTSAPKFPSYGAEPLALPSSSAVSSSATVKFTASTAASTAKATSSGTTSSKGMTPDATCGGENGWSCSGSPFGNCCSSFGWCGSTDAYCGQGCQSPFGDCTVQASSISSSMSSSSAASKASSSSAASTLSTVTAATKPSTLTTVATAASAKQTTCAPAPTTCGNVGMDFALQYHSWGDKTFNLPADPSIAVNVDYFKTASPAYVGTTTLTSFIGGNGANTDSKSFYGSPSFNPNLIAIHHRGYIYAKYSGSYTFSVDLSDNQVVLWLGSKAYTGWTTNNADSTNQYNNNPTADITLQMEACTYTPVRVLSINGNGPLTFQFSVTDPKGYQIIGPNSVANDGILKFACDDTLAPSFSTFGKE